MKLSLITAALLNILSHAEGMDGPPRPDRKPTTGDRVRDEMEKYFSLLTGENLTAKLEEAFYNSDHFHDDLEQSVALLRRRLGEMRVPEYQMANALGTWKRFGEWFGSEPQGEGV